MAWVRRVEEPEATSAVAVANAAWFAANPSRPPVPDSSSASACGPTSSATWSPSPTASTFADGHLTCRAEEVIATHVSAPSRCPYRTGSHGYFLQLQDPNADFLLTCGDHGAAPIPENERALLLSIELVTKHADKTTDADAQVLRRHGWTEPRIAEYVDTTAMFALFNRVADVYGLEGPNDIASESPGMRDRHGPELGSGPPP